jgi:two-component system sensor histidine kinase KdpD
VSGGAPTRVSGSATGWAKPGPLTLLRAARSGRGRLLGGYAIALAGTAVAVAAMLPLRDRITALSEGFVFLVVVVAAASVGGLWPGVVASLAGFATFNFFFIPPYGTFRIGRVQDVLVLLVFLGLSVLISVLFARASERAHVAEARLNELEGLQLLSEELVSMPPGPAAYDRVLRRLTWLFDCSSAALSLQRIGDYRGLEQSEAVGDETAPATFEERVPLTIGGRTLGLLVLRGNRGPMVPAERRVLSAFAAHLVTMLDRDRMLAASVRAQAVAANS